jgi:DNA polymerase/3'-5' exonuclease PolX
VAWLNEEVAGLLRGYAELTQITGGDVFRAGNYEKAARSVSPNMDYSMSGQGN